MSDAILVRPGPFTILPEGAGAAMSTAAHRAVDIVWKQTGFATAPANFTDSWLAREMGCSIRTAQRALHDLANLVVDGVARPLIDRFRQYGPREVAGRRIAIVAPEVVPVEKEEPGPESKPAPKAGAKPATSKPIPNVGVIEPASPEIAERARAQAASVPTLAAAATDEPVDPDAIARWRKEAEAALRGAKRAARLNNPADPVEPKPRR